jgi:AAA domain
VADRNLIEERSQTLLTQLRSFVAGSDGLGVVKAPPGSGKTFLLLQLVEEAVRLKLRLAIAAQTNSQADDICERLARDYPHVSTFRFVASGMIPNPAAPFTYISRTHELPAEASVVVATTAKWGMVDVPVPFDLLLVDEAWQMGWADFMLLGRICGRFILIGDPGQIPPTVTIPVERWETSPRAPHQAAPELLVTDPAVSVVTGELPACRRLPADAVDLVRPFYDFQFDAWAQPGERYLFARSASHPDELDRAIDSLRDASAVAVSIDTPGDGPPLEEDREVADVAAALVTRILERKAQAAADDDGTATLLVPEQIGISSTHRAMNSAIERALPNGLRGRVRVDTPERWQGLERKLMVAVHPLSSVIHPTAFDLETGRLCVMASRHRSGLIVITRDHIARTLETHIPAAEQAVGRPDITGRGHQQHLGFWEQLERDARVVHV